MLPNNGDVSAEINVAQKNVDRRLTYLLQKVMEQVPADVTAIYTYRRDTNALELAAWNAHTEPDSLESINSWLSGQLQLLTPVSVVRILNLDIGECAQIQSALLWPLTMWDSIIGAVALLSQQAHHYTQQHIARLEPLVMLAQTALENIHLAERLITTEAIALTAQAITRNPSPQNIVHVLRDYLFDVHISGCMIGLFGPVRHDRPKGPFKYIEIRGSWSRHLGSKVGLGQRLSLTGHEDMLARLEQQRFITINDFSDANIDDFSSVLFGAQHPQSLTLLSLHSEKAKLGILIITTDEPHDFTTHELRTYQIVTEFLTMSTMAAALQQQADYVQQSRAALLDAVTDSVVMVQPDEAASILTVNEHFTSMFGLKASEVEGVSLWHLVKSLRITTGIRHDLLNTWRSTSTRSPQTQRGEFRINSVNGNSSDIQWYSGPVYQDGQVIGRIFTFHDITPERAAERLRSELLSRISHELRTPLTSIRGFAEFILEAEGDNLPDLAREYTEIILKSSKHLNHIFTDMIEITRANAGELKMQFSNASLTDLILDVIARMKPQSAERQETIITKLDESIPDARIDIDRIDQVLTNLISNAIKYSGEGSEVQVTAHYAPDADALPDHAPADTPMPCIIIGVIDQGTGLSKAEAEKIFLPFYRTKDARAQKIEGAGLGLAISRSIVELHHGHIWVEPTTRRKPGGRFYFSISTFQQED